MEKNTGTILKVYLLDKTASGKEEGFVTLWKHKGKAVQSRMLAFDRLHEIPGKVEKLLRTAKIKRPPPT